MKACSYCGRENEDGQETCPGCGIGFRPPKVEAEFNGVLDPITPPRRCHCGGVMRYYTPKPGGGTFLRPYRYRYRCSGCGRVALVLPWDQRPGMVGMAVVGFAALLWLGFSKTAAEFDRSWWNTRWTVIAIVLAAVGLAAGHLALVGYWNRRRFPITDEPPPPPDRQPPSGAQAARKI